SNIKVHAKLCVIRKKVNNKTIQYGFVSTGNLNEKTARIYADHCLLTSDPKIMADINRIFNYLEQPKTGLHWLKACKTIIPSPELLRKALLNLINVEIRHAKKNKPASIILKMNSLSDEELVAKLYEAARHGVVITLIIRGIFCMFTQQQKFKKSITAISIVDELLEHARVWVFHHGGKEKVYISSADWMVRNLDHRVEASCLINNKTIRQELKDILEIQLSDNVKARWLNNELTNEYVKTKSKKKIRSQVETYNYLFKKTLTHSETGSH
ncbi:MAG TPA: phospholipase D-like domain-containing protein, partial [Chitinophagaceae bacterium]|nr:phospholipase D-like domain-containing protein [Chitinophagaceae bacterium]